jgi:hypothetical protein
MAKRYVITLEAIITDTYEVTAENDDDAKLEGLSVHERYIRELRSGELDEKTEITRFEEVIS